MSAPCRDLGLAAPGVVLEGRWARVTSPPGDKGETPQPTTLPSQQAMVPHALTACEPVAVGPARPCSMRRDQRGGDGTPVSPTGHPRAKLGRSHATDAVLMGI